MKRLVVLCALVPNEDGTTGILTRGIVEDETIFNNKLFHSMKDMLFNLNAEFAYRFDVVISIPPPRI